MRRPVAVLIAVMIALTLALTGCGGGGDQAETPAAAPSPAPTPAAVPAVVGGPVTGISDNVPPVFEPFPVGSSIATEVAENVAAKQPTLIYFYDSAQYTAAENRRIIDKVLDDNRGLVDLIAYDVGKYTTVDENGTITVLPAFAKDPTAIVAAGMARTLGASFTPYIVLTDTQGYIVWKFRGLIDKDFLEREVQRAAR